MIFITEQDLNSKVGADILAQLKQGNNIEDAELDAIGVVKDYLDALYDIDTELTKTGTDRHRVLVRYICILATYFIYEIVPDRSVPSRVVKDYNDTLADLVDLSKRKRQSSLPLNPPDQKPNDQIFSSSVFRMGGNRKRSH